MKWKGRRQSKNIEIIPPDPIARIIQKETKYTGGVSPMDLPSEKPSPMDRKPKRPHLTEDQKASLDIKKKLGDLNRSGKNPIPTPNPRRKVQQIQVTPGEWKTK